MFYVYILNDPDKPEKCKVGITKNPQQRLRTFRVAAPNASFYKLYSVPSKRHERAILDELRDVATVHNELVSCSPLFASRVVDAYVCDREL